MAAKKKTTDKITVRVVSQPINEDGTHYPKGAVFETTQERASALGAWVETVLVETVASEPADDPQ